jgi:ferredoxin
MKIHVDKETCIGCGVCVAIASKYFRIGDDGKSEPIKEEVDPEDEELVRTAAQSCPTGSIKIEE